mgnify:FL=1
METMKKAAWQFIDTHQEEMLALWRELVQIESGSQYKAGVDAVAQKVKSQLDCLGAKTRVIEMPHAGNMVVSSWGEADRAPILLLGHMDTVFPNGTIRERPFTIQDGKAYGPGVLDMKGGLVIALYAVKALQAAGYQTRPIKWILAGDEEMAHQQSNAAACIQAEAKGAAAAFNCETGFLDNGLVVQRKGSAVYTMRVQGVGAHAGNNPKGGRSAVLEIAHKVIDIQNATDWEKGTTFNVGLIQGGTVVNAVPDAASIQIDVRYLQPEYIEDIQQTLQQIAAKQYVPDTKTTLQKAAGFAPMKRTEATEQLFETVKKTYEEMGLPKPHAMMVGGGSDSAYTVLAGVPTVCAMGVKGAYNHTPREYADTASLFERAKVLAACIINRQ